MTKSTPALKPYSPGTPVSWPWGRGTAHAVVENVHIAPITIISKGGTRVTRNASPTNPAYTLVQPDKFHKILKSHSEISETL